MIYFILLILQIHIFLYGGKRFKKTYFVIIIDLYTYYSALKILRFALPNALPINTFRFCFLYNVLLNALPSALPTQKKRYFRPFKPVGNPLSQRKSFEYNLNTNKTTTYNFLLGAIG